MAMEALFTVDIILLLSIAVEKKTIYCNDDRITECNTIDTRNSSTVYVLLYKLIVECPWPELGEWKSFKSCGANTFIYVFDYRPRNSHRSLWVWQCVSSWWPLDWFWYLHEIYIDIWFTFKGLTDGVCHFDLFVLYDGERDDLWRLALSGHWLSCTGCYQYLLNMKYLMYIFTIVHLPKMFPPMNIPFENRVGLATIDFLCIIFTYQTQDDQQCFKLSNWFPLWYLGPWVNHLPPVWLSTFRFMF